MLMILEPTDDRARPAFTDAAACSKWLNQLQLTNLNLAQTTLRTQLDELCRYAMRGKERLKILEILRVGVHTVQSDFAKKLFGKRLPLSTEEFALITSLCDLWESLRRCYLRCLQTLDAGDNSLAAEAALLLQRCLLYRSQQMLEFLHAGYEPDADAWLEFHALYAQAEGRGLHLIEVADEIASSSHAQSCRTLYAKTLLLHRARLLGLRRNQWFILGCWMDHWGSTFSVEPSCSMTREDAPPLAVDLAGNRGLISIRHASASPSMRYLAMVPLSKLIRVKTILLEQGQAPQQNGLGDSISSKDSISLLNKLHVCWCDRTPDNLAEEMRKTTGLQICCSLENIYAQISRKPFRPPSATELADKEAQRQIEAFGRVLDQTDRHNLLQLGFLSEDCLVDEDGLLHARLLRKRTSGGERLTLNQLILVHEPDMITFKVGVVTLVSVTRSGQLYIGVRYLPGKPQAVVVRGASCANLNSGVSVALVLPELANLHIPASLIIPRDWFLAGRPLTVTLGTHTTLDVQLGISVEKGHDFERVSFTTTR